MDLQEEAYALFDRLHRQYLHVFLSDRDDPACARLSRLCDRAYMRYVRRLDYGKDDARECRPCQEEL